MKLQTSPGCREGRALEAMSKNSGVTLKVKHLQQVHHDHSFGEKDLAGARMEPRRLIGRLLLGSRHKTKEACPRVMAMENKTRPQFPNIPLNQQDLATD